ncbi:hypothetical protein A3F08_03680 [Candidatus Berkelbacteria bacterium RIFCSPHIGHO2_12_FULL_36_9]|uniref:DDH domain-containing protein n=1 Tax=Candidatus Berkelbacteria bacterium RIFCSPHIGHO2_12_FULL_36_9 TaxID=1797469 RepID=A0A1F5EI64_9BACT|nr:MAG: hypothetical protein A3F08_03680 [Candidatus Berkelbacteria bacterium RIFCSPHIGHO2_12_FULL_36_9]
MKNKVLTRIEKSENVLLLTHENPDGDALGSLLALSLSLEKINKKAVPVCPDKIAKLFHFLPESQTIRQDFLLGDFDLIIILDCGDLRRTGFADRLKEFSKNKRKIINIDHHPKNDLHRISALNLVDYSASSTAEIIYKLINNLKIEIDSNIATALLCGIYTDTGAFKHSNTSTAVLDIASDLMRKGARLKKITENISNGRSVSALKLWGVALSRIQKNEKLGIVTSFITKDDLEKCSACADDLAGIVNMINAIPKTKAAILFSEVEDGKIKASLRTESERVDVSRLANIFGGGGLKKASGFTINGHLRLESGRWKIEN